MELKSDNNIYILQYYKCIILVFQIQFSFRGKRGDVFTKGTNKYMLAWMFIRQSVIQFSAWTYKLMYASQIQYKLFIICIL